MQVRTLCILSFAEMALAYHFGDQDTLYRISVVFCHHIRGAARAHGLAQTAAFVERYGCSYFAQYMPVAGQGGNAGAQSLAIVMRGLVMREIPRGKIRGVIFKESVLGIATGAVTGVVTGVVAWLWNGNPWLGLVIGVAMVLNLFVAGLSGATIPILMKSVGLDPAQSSSIVLTTVTDIVGFFAFLGCALLFQQHLV